MKRLIIILICLFICNVCYAVNLSLRDLIQQEQQLLQCKNNCDIQMNNFYKNLITHVPNQIDGKDYIIHSDEYHNYTLEPNTDIVYFCPNEWIGMWINYKHLQKYKNISKTWKQYLNLYEYGDPIELLDYQGISGVKFVNNSERFIKQNPDFPFNYYLEDRIADITQLVCNNGKEHPFATFKDNRIKKFCSIRGIDMYEGQ